MEETEENNKKATFNLGKNIYERINQSHTILEMLRYKINTGQCDLQDLRDYWATNELAYIQIRSILAEEKSEKIWNDLRFVEAQIKRLANIQNIKGTKVSIPVKLFETIKAVHMEILDIHQSLGLGILTSSDDDTNKGELYE